jgi:hypothetical protein
MSLRWAVGLLVFSFQAIAGSPELKPETLRAWDAYTQAVELRTKQEVAGNRQFLWIDQEPLRAARVRRGEILAASELDANGLRAVPNGLIHDWVGAVFIPGVTLAKVLAVVHDYDRYGEFYRPGVVDAAVIGKRGEEERFRIRYVQKMLFVSEFLDSEYAVRHVQLDPRRSYSVAQSVRLKEIRNQGGNPESGGNTDASRYIWRIYSISKYEQRDGGVYEEEENIVLSRAIPVSLRWLVEPAIRHLSSDLIVASLRKTREAVRSNVVGSLTSADLPGEFQ